MTTTSSAQRMAPTGCRPVLVAASSADGGLMLRPTAGVALLTAGASWPEPLLLELDVVGAVVPDVAADEEVLAGDGDADVFASARSLATTVRAWALRLAGSGR
jgi:hypothetical protein